MTMFADAGSDISWAAVIMAAIALSRQLFQDLVTLLSGRWKLQFDAELVGLRAELKSVREKAETLEEASKKCEEERVADKEAAAATIAELKGHHEQTVALCEKQQSEINRLNVVNNLPVSTPLPIEPKPPGAPDSKRRPETA